MRSSDSVRWPERLWIVRHGESAGNLARDAADAGGLDTIDIAGRDVDVTLSKRGVEQAEALGRYFGGLVDDERPTSIFSSPYARALETSSIVRRVASPPSVTVRADERLREKEFGVLNRLTRRGIMARYPLEAESRSLVGKFYYRPPGGESWCDVIFRLRSFVDTMCLRHAGDGARILIVAHQVVVLCLRYLLENMTEDEILAIDRAGDVANCSITEYELEGDALRLVRYNFVAPLRSEGVPVTAKPDTPVIAP